MCLLGLIPEPQTNGHLGVSDPWTKDSHLGELAYTHASN